MKFLVPNYSCLQNPWLGGGYRPQIPVLSVLCPQLNLLNPPRTKFLGKPLDPADTGSCTTKSFVISHVDSFSSVTVSGTSFFTTRRCSEHHKNQPNVILPPPTPRTVRAKRPILLNILHLTSFTTPQTQAYVHYYIFMNMLDWLQLIQRLAFMYGYKAMTCSYNKTNEMH